MKLMLQRRLLVLVQAMAIAWPASAFALELHTPGPIPPVDDDDDDDDGKPGGGSGGGSIDPDDDEGASDEDDEDDDEDTLWTGRNRRSLDARQVQ